MEYLNWQQVSAWRLAGQYLASRARRKELPEVISRIGGVQAQLMSAAELALLARLEDLSAADVESALWQSRSLLKTWVMRGTLHLIKASDLPLFVAARAAFEIRRPPSYYTYHGVTPEEMEAILEGIPEVLGREPITREQLASAVAERAGKPNLREVLLSGWGALLKPSAFRGDLCFGPNQGQNVTFVRPEAWIGAWQLGDPQEAIQEVARRYLAAYGPATPEDFARWWGAEASKAKKVFRALASEIEEVDVEGWKAYALLPTIEQIQGSQPTHHLVRLLPQFDAYTLGVSRDCEYILPKIHKGRVYRSQGWISAVVLVDGRMEGVWELAGQRPNVEIKIEMFGDPADEVQAGLQAEKSRIIKFLEGE